MAEAVATNFFYAIHHGKLEATVYDREINRDTLEIELDRCPGNEPAMWYYQAIRDCDPETTLPSGRLEQMGQSRVYIST